ncbi:something about silencing protein 10 [Echinococcus multilocularis]|uniref:Something about silencing protein 10 n=1 Tax=Echinococcus multilocularis TaxID=6211 RepID=A0A068Y9G0_ECHMU|nr:something about silencing protein 10 [Echinococcus multilocularis]
MPLKAKEQSSKKAQSRYYGGDKYDENDEESVRLFLKDCHQRQSSLYTIHPSPHSSIAFFTSPLSRGELLYSSGQSRLQLHIREDIPSASNKRLDFLIFEKAVTNVCKLLKFPETLDEEAAAFRSHGFPLLVWPRSRDKATVQKYLNDNYPDCGLWFRELDKCQTWLNEKWIPLAEYLGLETPTKSGFTSAVLQNLPPDSVTATFVKERIAWLSNYCGLLQSYLVHRRIATPGFHHNPIHRQLRYLHGERQKTVADDSGFFNVAGDRLLCLARSAASDSRVVELRIHEMAKQIANSQQRAQFLGVLLPLADLKSALSQERDATANSSNTRSLRETKAALTEALNADSEEEATPEGSNDDENEAMDVDNSDEGKSNGKEGEKHPRSVLYPNRPATKEIMENRGIVKYRHKRERNPRVHLRYKYRKAQIRYKSRVPNIRKEDTPYAGELRGIRVNVIKSHKFKKPT